MGNTGSKTTIHRYLRELEGEEGGGPARTVAVSDALQDLVARLASRLQEEAEAILTQERERHQAELHSRQQALSGAQEEAAALSSRLQRTEASLHQEQAAHALLQQNLGDRIAEIAQLNERIAGMTVRLADHEAHTRSLEDKHAHAREALECRRTQGLRNPDTWFESWNPRFMNPFEGEKKAPARGLFDYAAVPRMPKLNPSTAAIFPRQKTPSLPHGMG